MAKKTKRPLWAIEAKTQKRKNYVGIHLIAEFWNGKIIESKKEIKEILIKAARVTNCKPIKVIIKKFLPHGITGVVLLAESHIALHFWPEYNYLAVDIFTCGKKALPHKALDYFKKIFQPKKVRVQEIKRGVI